MDIEVKRWREGEHMLWQYIGFTARLRRLGPPETNPDELDTTDRRRLSVPAIGRSRLQWRGEPAERPTRSGSIRALWRSIVDLDTPMVDTRPYGVGRETMSGTERRAGRIVRSLSMSSLLIIGGSSTWLYDLAGDHASSITNAPTVLIGHRSQATLGPQPLRSAVPPLRSEALPSTGTRRSESLPSPSPLRWEALPDPSMLGWEALPATAPAVLGSEVALSAPQGRPSLEGALGSTIASNPDDFRGSSGVGDHTVVAHAAVPTIVARSGASGTAQVIETFSHPTEIGGPLVFQAIGQPVDDWIEVRLPIRPNGTTGWVRVDDVELTRNPYRINVDVDGHELTLFNLDEPVLTTPVAIGTGETPTPIGDFYLTELVRPPDPDGLYGPYAYGLSGFSETLTSFNGGPGVIGIHGTDRPDLLGTDVSRGCIRLDNDVITHIVQFLPLGTPISIH